LIHECVSRLVYQGTIERISACRRYRGNVVRYVVISPGKRDCGTLLLLSSNCIKPLTARSRSIAPSGMIQSAAPIGRPRIAKNDFCNSLVVRASGNRGCSLTMRPSGRVNCSIPPAIRSTPNPPSCTRRWCRRHNKVRLSSDVLPPFAQCRM
jgi:hypothetical protein